MHLGQLLTIYRQQDAATSPAEACRLHLAEAVWLWDLSTWTPSTSREVVQACRIAWHFLDHAQVPPSEGLDNLRACLWGIATNLRREHRIMGRSGYRDMGRAMRLLAQRAAEAGLDAAYDGPELDAIGALRRAASPRSEGGRAWRAGHQGSRTASRAV